jgi:hypothetical protein
MAITLDDSIKIGQAKAADAKVDNNGLTYADVAEVNSLLPTSLRYVGLAVLVVDPDDVNKRVEYWYQGGVADENLVLKTSASGGSGYVPYTGATDSLDMGAFSIQSATMQADSDVTANQNLVSKGTIRLERDNKSFVLSSENLDLESATEPIILKLPLEGDTLGSSVNGVTADINGNIALDVVTPSQLETAVEELEDFVINGIKDLPYDFFISTDPFGSTLNYKTDTYRTIDLQPLVSLTTINNTNDVIRDPENPNDLYLIANSNTNTDSTTPVLLIRLKDCKIQNNVFTIGSVTTSYLTVTSRTHGSYINRGFLYISTRPNTVATAPQVVKVNLHNFSDVKSISLPSEWGVRGSTDIISYKNKVYGWFVAFANTTGTHRFVEIDEDMVTYRTVFSYTNSAAPNRRLTTTSPPFLIHNEEIYTITSYEGNPNRVSIFVYDLEGNIKRYNDNLVISTGFSSYYLAHWMAIFNNKIIITPTGLTNPAVAKVMFRVDCSTLALEEVLNLNESITDDNTIFSDGYIYLNGESSPVTTHLIKIKYNDFTDFTYELSNYSSTGSLRTIDYKDRVISRLSQLYNDIGSGNTNLTYTVSPSNGIVNSDTGTDATIPAADTTNAGLLLPADKVKLNNTSGTNTGDNAVNTTSNTYADGKVANDLTASTTVAPSKTAVNNALALKANDNAVVHIAGTETITGVKTFGDSSTDTTAAFFNAPGGTGLQSTVEIRTSLTGNQTGLLLRRAGDPSSFVNFRYTTNGMAAKPGISFGLGSVGTDTFIYRDASNTLKTEGALIVGGQLTIPNGTASTSAVTKAQLDAITPLTATATLDFPNTGAASSSDLTITVTGAALGDVVTVGTPIQAANMTYTAFVSAVDTVTVRLNNYSVAAVNPPSGTFKVKVFKN